MPVPRKQSVQKRRKKQKLKIDPLLLVFNSVIILVVLTIGYFIIERTDLGPMLNYTPQLWATSGEALISLIMWFGVLIALGLVFSWILLYYFKNR
jgi:hypothetical protein